MRESGKVYLVGAGPGDPYLITLKGWMALREADVVIHDRLASGEILKWASEDACLVEAGKRPGGPSFSQDEINRLMEEKAISGHRVVRLKNGDPLIFGRGFEEAIYLWKRGLDFEIIPGPSSATAVPAQAGIPLTHRGVSRSAAIITGHIMEQEGFPNHDWAGIATTVDTLVILMGAGNLERIIVELERVGVDPRKPAAAITWGSTAKEKTVFSSLADLPRKLEEEGVGPPVTLVIGDTVKLGERVRSRSRQNPLRGARIMIPREWDPEDRLSRLLILEGAFVRHVPAIKIEGRECEEVRNVFTGSERYDFVVFTSRNSVSHLFRHLRRYGLDARVFAGSLLCAIGPGTAHVLYRHGLRADLVPDNHSTRGIQEALSRTPLVDKKILLVRSNLSDRRMRTCLEKRGAKVRELHPYAVRIADAIDHELVRTLENGDLDVILLTSPSCVKGLMNMIGGKGDLLRRVTVGCIGPVTARAAKKSGISTSFTATVHSDDGLFMALSKYLEGVKNGHPAASENLQAPR